MLCYLAEMSNKPKFFSLRNCHATEFYLFSRTYQPHLLAVLYHFCLTIEQDEPTYHQP
jgi:hypothetical protein